jgi:hypothetical protein
MILHSDPGASTILYQSGHRAIWYNLHSDTNFKTKATPDWQAQDNPTSIFQINFHQTCLQKLSL